MSTASETPNKTTVLSGDRLAHFEAHLTSLALFVVGCGLKCDGGYCLNPFTDADVIVKVKLPPKGIISLLPQSPISKT